MTFLQDWAPRGVSPLLGLTPLHIAELSGIIVSVVALVVVDRLLGHPSRLAPLLLKTMRRNLIRTLLTFLAVFVLVFVATMVWSVLSFLDDVTAEKAKEQKAIVTERWKLPSQMPLAYRNDLMNGAAFETGDVQAEDFMSWQFYGGTLDPNNRTRENTLFFFCTEPDKLRSMMDDLENLDPEVVRKMKENKRGCIIGRERLATLQKRVGDKFKVYSLNYKGIDLELDIVGTFPDGRYNQSAIMNCQYFEDALDQKRKAEGKLLPPYDRTLGLVWLKVPDSETFRRVAEQVEDKHKDRFTDPAVKCETASSGISAFLEGYRDLMWIMRVVVQPAILFTMALVIALAISISVRERRTEVAVLKVLGYRPWQILLLVLGEAALVGAASGFLSTAIACGLINLALGGLKFPIAFFPSFLIPWRALWLGPLVGGLAALAGSVVPAWGACKVKVSDVFAKVA